MSKTPGPQSVNLGRGGITNFDTGPPAGLKAPDRQEPTREVMYLVNACWVNWVKKGMTFGVKETFTTLYKSWPLSEPQFPYL